MPWSRASTSSCERICWFIVSRSLNDETREMNMAHRAFLQWRLGGLVFAVDLGLAVVVVLELDAQRPHRLAHHLDGQLLLAGAGQQLLRGLVRQHHQDAV